MLYNLNKYRWGSILLIITFFNISYSQPSSYILYYSSLISDSCYFINVPSFDDTLKLSYNLASSPKWSPTGNYIAHFGRDIPRNRLIIKRTNSFTTINSTNIGLGYIFIRGDTFIRCDEDTHRHRCVCKLYPPPFFRNPVDSFFLPESSVCKIFKSTYDGRFLMIHNCRYTYDYIYDRFNDSIINLYNYPAMSKQGNLVYGVVSRTYTLTPYWTAPVYDLIILNLYHPSDTIIVHNIFFPWIPFFWSIHGSICDIADNSNEFFMPILVDSMRVKTGIIKIDLNTGEIKDTIYPKQIYQDTFVTTYIKVSPNSEYAVLDILIPGTLPHTRLVRTIFYDLQMKRQIAALDSVYGYYTFYSTSSFSPVHMRLPTKIIENTKSTEKQASIFLYSNQIIIDGFHSDFYSLSLLDLTGRIVHRWQVEPKNGDKIILPLPEGLPNGVYLLRAGSGKIVGKVVLVR